MSGASKQASISYSYYPPCVDGRSGDHVFRAGHEGASPVAIHAGASVAAFLLRGSIDAGVALLDGDRRIWFEAD